MFNFGISEIMIIAVIGLVVIGPERLPKVARTMGHMFSRFQRYVSEVKTDINKEIQLEELKSIQDSMKEAATSIEESVAEQVSFIESEVDDADKSLKKSLTDDMEESDTSTVRENPTDKAPSGELEADEQERFESAEELESDADADVVSAADNDKDSEETRRSSQGINLMEGLGLGTSSDLPDGSTSGDATSVKSAETENTSKSS